jgi:hypothetical protein
MGGPNVAGTQNLQHTCPNCGHKGLWMFYEVSDVPVHSCLMMKTRDESLAFPKGDITLGFCDACGLITNTSFDPSAETYAANYEDQQTFSPTFNAIAADLVDRLIEKHDLHDKDIIEIGCSKGDFLVLLCERGPNRGIGIDPACVEGRVRTEAADRIKFIPDYYSEKHADLPADFACCRHTLEHIHHTAEFMTTLRRSLGERPDTVIFFDMPDATRVLAECAFWDIYYEHCSYFTPGSLARLFRCTGFEITDLGRDFDDQWVMIEAVPSRSVSEVTHELEESVETTAGLIREFVENVGNERKLWKDRLAQWRETGRRAAVWGSGSKCVAFLTTMEAADLVDCVVDINPHRHGLFIPGVGKEVVAPEFLKEFGPHEIVVMNPIYEEEIRQMLDSMGLRPDVTSLGIS